MGRRALAGACAACVSLFVPVSALAADDIVLHASDATNLHGNWILASDSTAADGQLLSSADNGWSAASAPLAMTAA